MADDSIISYSDLIGDDGTFEEISKHIDKLQKELIALAKLRKKALKSVSPNDSEGVAKMTKEVNELATSQKNLNKVNKAVAVAKKKNIDLTNEELIQREKEKLVNRERIQVAKQTAIIRKAEKNNIESIRAQLSLTTLEWKKLTAGELKNSKAGKNLVKQKKDLTGQLKKLEKATGDNRRNVGNYTSALNGLNGVMVGFGGSIGVTVGAFGSMVKGLRSATQGMNFFKIALASTGIGLLIIGLGSLVAYFTRTQKGLDFLNRGFKAISTVVDVFIDRLAKVGEAIVLIFSLEFSAAADKFKESVSGVTDELINETKAADELIIKQQELDKSRIASQNVIKGYQNDIARLREEATELKEVDSAAAKQKIKEAIEVQRTLSKLLQDQAIEQRDIIVQQAKLANNLNADNKEVQDAIGEVIDLRKQESEAIKSLTRELNQLGTKEKAQRKAASKARKEAKEAREQELAAQKKGLEELAEEALKASFEEEKARVAANELRLNSISEVIKEIEQLEAQGIEDKQERLLRLEELRFKTEIELRETQFQTLKEMAQGNAQALEEIKNLSDRKKEQQESDHLNNILKINKDHQTNFNAQRQAYIDEQDAENEAEDAKQGAIDDARVAASIEKDKKILDSKKKLIEDITDSASKVGEIIVGIFEKQADLSEKAVNSQVDNLDKARERAQNGLSQNLAFEEQELSKRQSEQQRRQKESEQAARLLSLFNLVSAYASNGDEQALTKAFVDFSLLTAFAAGIGFEEGGYTGDKGTKQVAGVVHGKEYVVTAADTAKYNLTGKSGDDFGTAMSDYYNPQSPVLQNPYKTQKESFEKSTKVVAQSSNKDVINELKAIKQQLANQPNMSAEIVKMYEGVYGLVKEESRRNMKVITRTKLKERL